MDVDYGDIQWAPGPVDTEFEQCLFVLTQVISTRADGVAVVDAGLKALAFDSGMPAVHDNKGISYTRPSDEHGILEVSGSAKKLPLGSKLKLVPGHCDPTVNLHRALIGLKHDRVEAVWPIDA
jgi:D-serine deaminase-like pyridoxal phosphate-dependent protein